METLRKYILYFLVGIAICLVGASGVFADSTLQSFSGFNSTATSYNNSLNYNNDVYAVETVDMYNQEMSFEWTSTNTKTCSTGAVVSGKLRIEKLSMGITNSDFSWNNVYIVNNNNKSNCSWQVHDNDTTYVCSLDSLNTNFKIGYTLNPMGGQFTYSSYIFRTIDISCDTSTSQIIENNSQNTQNIINNNNQNTQAIIDSNKVCTLIDQSSIKDDNKYLSSGTTTTNSSLFGVTDYINVFGGEIKNLITYTENWNVYSCFYDVNKDPISCVKNNSLTSSFPDGSYYVRLSIYKTYNQPQFELCKNGNQATNDAINDLNDTLTDSSSVDVSSLGNTVGWLPAGPIDSILNLPLNFFNSINNALSGTCQNLNITIPFISEQISIPCLSTIFSQINGLTTFWNWVGRIASIYILYKYLLALWDYYDRLTTMQANFRDDFGGGV